MPYSKASLDQAYHRLITQWIGRVFFVFVYAGLAWYTPVVASWVVKQRAPEGVVLQQGASVFPPSSELFAKSMLVLGWVLILVGTLIVGVLRHHCLFPAKSCVLSPRAYGRGLNHLWSVPTWGGGISMIGAMILQEKLAILLTLFLCLFLLLVARPLRMALSAGAHAPTM